MYGIEIYMEDSQVYKRQNYFIKNKNLIKTLLRKNAKHISENQELPKNILNHKAIQYDIYHKYC